MAFAGVELRYVTSNLNCFGHVIPYIEKIRFSTHHAGYTAVSRGGSASYSLSLVLADGRPTGLVLAARYLVRRYEEFYENQTISNRKPREVSTLLTSLNCLCKRCIRLRRCKGSERRKLVSEAKSTRGFSRGNDT